MADVGRFLAALVRSKDFVRERYIGVALAVFAVAAPLAVIMDLRRAEWIVFTFTSLTAGAIVYLAMFWKQSWLQRPLSNRVLLFTGTISYGLFLLHKIAFAGVDGLHVNYVGHPFVTLGVIFVGSYVLAIISWNVLEQPFLRLKRFLSCGGGRTPRSLVARRSVLPELRRLVRRRRFRKQSREFSGMRRRELS